MSFTQASKIAGFIERTCHKCLKRFYEEMDAGLWDCSSQPHRPRRSHELGLVGFSLRSGESISLLVLVREVSARA